MELEVNPYGPHVVWDELTSYVTLHQARLSNTLNPTSLSQPVQLQTCAAGGAYAMLRGLPRRQAAPNGHVEQQELAAPLAVQHPRPGLMVLGLQHSTQTVKAAAHIPARALLRACCVPCLLLPLPMLLTCQVSGQASLGPSYKQIKLHI